MDKGYVMFLKLTGNKPFNKIILKKWKGDFKMTYFNTTHTISILFSGLVDRNTKFNGLHIWHSSYSLPEPVDERV